MEEKTSSTRFCVEEKSFVEEKTSSMKSVVSFLFIFHVFRFSPVLIGMEEKTASTKVRGRKTGAAVFPQNIDMFLRTACLNNIVFVVLLPKIRCFSLEICDFPLICMLEKQ